MATVSGTGGNDSTGGGSSNDSIEGGAGDDTLWGFGGDDSIWGGWWPRYTKHTGTSQSFSGTNGGSNFNGTVSSNETLTADTQGSVSGYRVGDSDSNEAHTHSFSREIAGAKISFNVLDLGETLTVTIDGVTLNLNDAIKDGYVAFNDANGVYTIDSEGRLTGTTNDYATLRDNIGELTILKPFSTLTLTNAGSLSDSMAGTVYEVYADTNPPTGTGDDSLSGGDGKDTIYGGDGNDVIDGGNDNDFLYGGTGDDSILGGAGADKIYGGDGRDTILGGSGADALYGGADADTFVITDGFGSDTIDGGETASTGSDNDTLDLSQLTGAVTVTFTGSGAGTVSDGTHTLTFTGIERIIATEQADVVNASADATGIEIIALGGDDSVTGGSGDDSLDGGDGADSLLGGSGKDTILGGGGDDFIDGGSASDSIQGGSGNDTIDGGGNTDTIYGGAGDDSIYDTGGSLSDDTIYGEGGNDTIAGGEREDLLDGGDDADTFIIEDNFGNDTIIGGEGGVDLDTIDLSRLTAPVTVTYTGNEAGTITDGTDTITFSQVERLILTDQADVVDATADSGGVDIDAGAGNDTLVGGTGDDTLLGGDGSDSIEGGDGADFIDGGLFRDTISGGAGADTISGGGGHDNIDGGDGNDVITGGAGADTIFGGAGDDYISGDGGGVGTDSLDGGTGNDTLDGGGSNDILTGGGGDDVFIISSGNDTITDFNFGNTGALRDGDSTNNDFVDLSAYYDSLSELRADQADDGILNQSNALDDKGRAVDYSDNTQFGTGSLTMQEATAQSYSADNTGVVCFTSGTYIRTPGGQVLIEKLSEGDLVCTLDNGPQPIAWIGIRTVTQAELSEHPTLRPICIKKGVFGAERDIFVSRQHGVMINDDSLVRVIHLEDYLGGVRVANGKKRVTYVHLMFDAHQIVFAENLATESFFPGPQALKMLAAPELDRLLSSFPQLRNIDAMETAIERYGVLARPFLDRQQTAMACRCLKAKKNHLRPVLNQHSEAYRDRLAPIKLRIPRHRPNSLNPLRPISSAGEKNMVSRGI